MLTLELFSYLLEFPNDAYTTLFHTHSVQHSFKSIASWLVYIGNYWEGNFEHYHALIGVILPTEWSESIVTYHNVHVFEKLYDIGSSICSTFHSDWYVKPSKIHTVHLPLVHSLADNIVKMLREEFCCHARFWSKQIPGLEVGF